MFTSIFCCVPLAVKYQYTFSRSTFMPDLKTLFLSFIPMKKIVLSLYGWKSLLNVTEIVNPSLDTHWLNVLSVILTKAYASLDKRKNEDEPFSVINPFSSPFVPYISIGTLDGTKSSSEFPTGKYADIFDTVTLASELDTPLNCEFPKDAYKELPTVLFKPLIGICVLNSFVVEATTRHAPVTVSLIRPSADQHRTSTKILSPMKSSPNAVAIVLTEPMLVNGFLLYSTGVPSSSIKSK